MQTDEQPRQAQPVTTNGEHCPFVRFEDMHAEITPALWHMDNLDHLRDQARVYFGDAAGHKFWMLTRIEDIRAALQNPELFSSRAVVPVDPDPPYMWIPEMLDPPVHTRWRQLLGPMFAPGAVAKLEPRVKRRFGEILDEVAPRGECDYVADVALRFPNTIFMEIMGLPLSDAEQFQAWETAILHTGATGNPKSLDAMNEVIVYFTDLVADRRRSPRDDLVSAALSFEIDGQSVSDDDLLAMCLLLFMAGLDTVAMQLSYSMMHLATHGEGRQRLISDPSLFLPAIEEFLRYYSFVTPGRKITADAEFHGCPVRAGQMAFLPLVAANRDPAEFPDADQVIIDRPDNRHIAFGAGPHRCLGSHLARQELRIGLTEWHARIPNYALAEGAEIREHGGQIGLNNLPLVWQRAS
jgi:cytochrome P450